MIFTLFQKFESDDTHCSTAIPIGRLDQVPCLFCKRDVNSDLMIHIAVQLFRLVDSINYHASFAKETL